MRGILSVVVGYVAMFVVVAVSFGVAYGALGVESVFEPGSFEPSGTWLMVMFVVSIVAAVAGGFVAALIARNPKPPLVLAGLVLLFGLIMAVPPMLSDDPPAVRSADLSGREAMQQAKQPIWVALLTPFIGAGGVLIGARLRPGGGS